MTYRLAAPAAALLVALFAATQLAGSGRPAAAGPSSTPESQVLAGRSTSSGLGHDRVPMPTREPGALPSASATARPTPRPPAVNGIASNYPGTAGYIGQPVVALPGAMGGRYTGEVQGYVTVCGDRCARLPVVDWCQCYWGTSEQRVVDISYAAWKLVSDEPLSRGLIEVQVILDDPTLAAAWSG